ncbi:hypothetical protein ABE61_18770 [Lysinibacillus sphaericus]|uniref:DEAD/DEAH box helicase n=1 Tax=Lysinibacillus sphaericus TaxID=1421 RepID=UPI0018CCB4DF|nr:ATP-binding domain-containing protein [Lysinibacillus sphaericus]MBG9456030.1 hypothetical protein [Lysinibacillus sphaericus]MBG9479317.1 hypothetical protein [Lysinibacillus sphaericus]MBG9593428.1 hypothetical protein [Lysinibacillus sphaericus]
MEIKIYDKVEYRNDAVAQQVKIRLEEIFEDEEILGYYKEPDYWTTSNTLPTFTLCSKKYGVIIIKVYDYNNDNLFEINDKFWIKNGKKVRNELLGFEDYCYKFKNDIDLPTNEIYSEIPFTRIAIMPFVDKEILKNEIKRSKTILLFSEYRTYDLKGSLPEAEFEEEDWQKLISVIQKSNILNKENNYIVETPLENLRDAIAYNNQSINLFDEDQLDASMTITEGAQRIRGLAGSGKTVILSIKAARLHRKNRKQKIAYVFSTHSLYKQVTELVNKYYGKLTGERLDPDYLEIIHAWGGKTTGPGFYYNICLSNGITPLTVWDLKFEKEKFDEACKRLLRFNLKEEYDHVLIDEAQDLPLSFFKLVEKVTKKPKNIIWAYDDLQTTNEVKIPNAQELFGQNGDGTDKVELNKENDYILKKSYRNHKDVLLTALAFGFGLYAEDGIVQMIKEEKTWNALGFKVQGDLNYEKRVKIIRPIENSPNNPVKEYSKYPILNVNTFNSYQEEIETVAAKIKELIEVEKVRPEDIMVVDIYNYAKARLSDLQGILYRNEILSTIPGIVDGARDFFKEESVTLTTVRRAKGNEVPVVFVIGCEKALNEKNLYEKRILRNMLFISITRSKGWIFISSNKETGVDFSIEFNKMYNDILRGEFNFIFPDRKQFDDIKELNLLAIDNKKVEKLQNRADIINELIENGDLSAFKMFLSKESIEKLKELSEEDD